MTIQELASRLEIGVEAARSRVTRRMKSSGYDRDGAIRAILADKFGEEEIVAFALTQRCSKCGEAWETNEPTACPACGSMTTTIVRGRVSDEVKPAFAAALDELDAADEVKPASDWKAATIALAKSAPAKKAKKAAEQVRYIITFRIKVTDKETGSSVTRDVTLDFPAGDNITAGWKFCRAYAKEQGARLTRLNPDLPPWEGTFVIKPVE